MVVAPDVRQLAVGPAAGRATPLPRAAAGRQRLPAAAAGSEVAPLEAQLPGLDERDVEQILNQSLHTVGRAVDGVDRLRVAALRLGTATPQRAEDCIRMTDSGFLRSCATTPSISSRNCVACTAAR